jgi:hypothetical protein
MLGIVGKGYPRLEGGHLGTSIDTEAVLTVGEREGQAVRESFFRRFPVLALGILGFGLLLVQGAYGADARLEQLQALEHELLSERDALLARTEDPNLVFLATPEGGILTFNRAALERIVRSIAFLAVEDDLAAQILPKLPPDIRGMVGMAQAIGIWNEEMITDRAFAEITRRSEAARLEARRRVHTEYDGLIEEVRTVAAGLVDDPCDSIPGVWSWFVNGDVTFSGDGTLVQGPLTGNWMCSEAEVTITWSHGFIDELTISADGLRMTGRNQNQTEVSGQRIVDAVSDRPKSFGPVPDQPGIADQ